MGIYDTVKYELDCEKCGFRMKEWQTKDAAVEVKSKSGRQYFLSTGFNSLKIEDIDSATMVGACPICSGKGRGFNLIELKIKKGKIVKTRKGSKKKRKEK